MSWPFCKNWCYTTTASTPCSTLRAQHTMWIIFSVCERSLFFKARFLKKYFYNSRIGKSSLSFYNFRMELLLNMILVSIGKPIKNSVAWYAYLKMSKLGDIPHYDGAGHIWCDFSRCKHFRSRLRKNVRWGTFLITIERVTYVCMYMWTCTHALCINMYA